jgi:hypothetical protein
VGLYSACQLCRRMVGPSEGYRINRQGNAVEWSHDLDFRLTAVRAMTKV